MNENNLQLVSGQGHIVNGMGNVDFQFLDGAVKNIS
jgi:hypothetical protein